MCDKLLLFTLNTGQGLKGTSFRRTDNGSEVDVLVLTDRPLAEKLKKWGEKFKGNHHSLRS